MRTLGSLINKTGLQPVYYKTCVPQVKATGELEFEARTKSKQAHQNLSESCKINPEGTCGPIWPGNVPLILPSHWPYYCTKKIVKMWCSKSDIFSDNWILKRHQSVIEKIALSEQKNEKWKCAESFRHLDIDDYLNLSHLPEVIVVVTSTTARTSLKKLCV